MLKMEALPLDQCSMCGRRPDKPVRCSDCFSTQVLCPSCCLEAHRFHPFHSVEEWNGKHFTPTCLFNLGHVLYLGHGGNPCPSQPDFTPMDMDDENSELTIMTVIHSNGVHKHRISWCACRNHPEEYIQLLQMRLYPATITQPSTVFTFQCLEYYKMDSLECRTNASNFYSKLRRLSDSAFPAKVPVSEIADCVFFLVRMLHLN